MEDKIISSLVNTAAKMLKGKRSPDWLSNDLPWRQQKTPYRFFIAEFLLVRTRTDVVERIFEDFLALYPNLHSIAKTDDIKLASALNPLGLKKRVPILIKAAQYLIEYHSGEIPDNVNDLMNVPGIGLYTATAIAAFAFGLKEVPADVNILRFISRLTGLPMSHPTKGSKELRELLGSLSVDRDGPKVDVLLDFTRLICEPRNPKCKECLLNSICEYNLQRVGLP
jgi:A/G-specific adenine glycosylase